MTWQTLSVDIAYAERHSHKDAILQVAMQEDFVLLSSLLVLAVYQHTQLVGTLRVPRERLYSSYPLSPEQTSRGTPYTDRISITGPTLGRIHHVLVVVRLS